MSRLLRFGVGASVQLSASNPFRAWASVSKRKTPSGPGGLQIRPDPLPLRVLPRFGFRLRPSPQVDHMESTAKLFRYTRPGIQVYCAVVARVYEFVTKLMVQGGGPNNMCL